MDDTTHIVPGDPSLRDAGDVAIELDVSATVGLSAAEAAARLARDGPNELRAKPPVPVWRRVLAQFQDPLVYLLLVAIVISLVAWLAEGAHGAPVDVIVIAIIVIANAALGFDREQPEKREVRSEGLGQPGALEAAAGVGGKERRGALAQIRGPEDHRQDHRPDPRPIAAEVLDGVARHRARGPVGPARHREQRLGRERGRRGAGKCRAGRASAAAILCAEAAAAEDVVLESDRIAKPRVAADIEHDDVRAR